MTTRHKVFVGIAGTVCLVSVILQTGIGLRHPRWFKGNLHAHSNRNEGDVPPVEVARWYKDHGYQFLALSDHNLMTDPAARSEAIPNRFLVLDATELGGQSRIHVGGIGVGQRVLTRAGLSRRGSLFDNVAAVREAGGIPSINHPQLSELTFTEVMHLDAEFLIEINEGRVSAPTPPAGGMSADELWDTLLSAGRTVYAVASDDARNFKGGTPRDRDVPGTGWIEVRAGALDGDAILNAIRKGEFYASTGVALNDVRWTGRELHVSIDGVAGGRYRTTFLGPHSRVLSVTLANPASYRPSPGDVYVRARVEDQDGHSAWTQPVRLSIEEAAGATKASASADLSRQIASALDAAPLEGPVMPVPPHDGSILGCDQPPGNSVDAGERALSTRRAIRGGAYENAKAHWVLTRSSSADLETVASEVRARYRSTIQANLPERTLTAVEVHPIVLSYPAGYAGNAVVVNVRGKTITLETVDARGRRGKLTTYYVNYDHDGGPDRLREAPESPPKLDANADKGPRASAGERKRPVVLVSTPQVPAEVALGLRIEGAVTGVAGKLAVSGLPVLVYDATGTGASSRPEEWAHGLYLEAADLQLLDSALLGHFSRVDLVGSTETLAHLLVSHRSRIESAYLVGFIPLWTRNDAAARTGGPFGTDEDTDHIVLQMMFQWPDFLLTAMRDKIDLALALNAGSSGLGKAGLLHEIVPALERFTSAFEIRGDDPDGDGFSRAKPAVCSGFDTKDVQTWLRAQGSGKNACLKP